MDARNSALPTRLVICVDGTSYSPSEGSRTQTNIYRIYAGIKPGKVVDKITGATFNQVLKYIPGLGSADDVFSTERAFGQGYLKQIQDVYESCCQLYGERDEVWLFGFSRGAFVIRAVAGLLHRYGAVTSAGQPEFGRDFKKALKDTQTFANNTLSPTSSISSISTSSFRHPPRIQFVGAFDTVKPGVDDSQFDISFNGSIQHLRHALALHEDRKGLTPEYIFPEEFYRTSLSESGRSLVQAYFIGNHLDMGGSAKKAGLSLYPLQWMLLEARACGLAIAIDGGARDFTDLRNPLAIVFPKLAGKKNISEWRCTTANGITVPMQDIRDVHEQSHGDYVIKMNTASGSIRAKKSRTPFQTDGMLRGYCDWAPQGTIIHPSVYLLLDERINIALETKELKLQRLIEHWRERMLGLTSEGVVNPGFWLDDDDSDNALNPGAIRVLVCGNTGVGKSTLINKTFGVEVTTSMNRSRGIHDVRQEITFEDRPDLIVHDSGGFEAGADDEFVAIEGFLKEKSAALDVKDRLHVIWFCVDINSPRTLQTATEKLFRAVSLYAKEVPIIVVATKKDDLLDLEFSKKRKAMKAEGKRFDEETCDEHAEEKLKERVETIRSEMESVPDGRLDACVATSVDDDASIANLSKITASCFDTDKVRLLYIRAQTSRIDLKIDLALCEIMRRYKKLIRSSTGSSFAPMGATINRKVSTNNVTKAIVNCFGLPTVSAAAAIDALKKNVWTTAGTNVTLALAEGFNLFGILAAAATGGMAGGAILITGGINSVAVVPATCRLFLMMSADLTLVLARSFKEVTFRQGGQPTERDVAAAARNYRLRGYSQHVHTDIKKLVPRRNMAASYKADIIGKEMEALVNVRYKDKLMEDIDLPLKVGRTRIGSNEDLDDDAGTEADSTIFSDLANLRHKFSNSSNVSISTRSATNLTAATTATPTVSTVSELDSGRPAVAEVEGDEPVAELADNDTGLEKDGFTELDASQTLTELPGDFGRKVDLKSGADAGYGGRDMKRMGYGV